MTTKYNLALRPIVIDKKVIALAQQFSHVAHQYQLGAESLPHITLYQFRIDETEINSIWEKVRAALDTKPINLTLDKVSYITFDNDLYWISLIPNQHEQLHDMHSKIASILNLPIKESFDPHMTLLNTQNNNLQTEIEAISASYIPLSDNFILTLGKSDPIGQFIEIVYQ